MKRNQIDPQKNMSMLQAMVACKCPVCTKGNMFKTAATDLWNFNELKEECEVCGFKFMPEPGFYQVSLFFTYAVGVAVFIVFGFIAYYLFNDPELWVYYVVILIPAILVTPWNLRYSKVLMLYFLGGVWNSEREEE
ncbi:DUF983 domain-containing protein [Litoribacter populi]|uniref:DUF983 domain-containing protein n=1 Tax=Litoribacter populi TaxID=2598460 RepID=UPI00117D442D|nr:DUF983 domain-containing protein [Litoribacter populi]